jgi:hypothetical protein
MNTTTRLSRVSLFAVRLEQFRKGKSLGFATGFVHRYKQTGKQFLITNYHVLTGRDPSNPAMLEPGYPDSPDEICWSVFTRPDFSIKTGCFTIDAETQWLEHSERNKGVDIAALALSFPEDAVVVSQSDIEMEDGLGAQVGMEVFIVGYPYGFGVHDILPIWKRGTIASEPRVRPDGLDKFYVDAYSHPGMSGSPVFAVARRQMIQLSPEASRVYAAHERGELSALELIEKLDPAELENGKFDGMAMNLIGIYAGRVRMPGNKDANLGVVYGASCLEEVFTKPVSAIHPFPPHET